MNYRGRNNTNYVLGSEIASGGEGIVYEVKNNNKLVAKIYHDRKLKSSRQYMKEKIETMLDQPVDPYVNGKLCITWPTDTLCDVNGNFVGFVMPKIDVKSSIIRGQRDDKVRFFKNYNYTYSVAMAYNIALIVSRVHATGSTVGDFNPKNILLKDTGEVVFVDADSFNIRNRRSGKVYKCTMSVPEMRPPELQGKDLTKDTSVFNEATDSFSLGIHIFQLLMNNQHPFAIIVPKTLRSSSSNSGLESSITQGRCPYVTGSQWAANIPAAAPDINMLPSYIRDLFDRTFSYNASNAVKASVINARPGADEWVAALERFYRSLTDKNERVICNADRSHVYLKSYGSCPFCSALRRRSGGLINTVHHTNKGGQINVVHPSYPVTTNHAGGAAAQQLNNNPGRNILANTFLGSSMYIPANSYTGKALLGLGSKLRRFRNNLKNIFSGAFGLKYSLGMAGLTVAGIIALVLLIVLVKKLVAYDAEQDTASYSSQSMATEEESSYVVADAAQSEEDNVIQYELEETDDHGLEYMSEDYVRGLSQQDIQMEINAIYAHHGYIFKDENLRNFFMQYDWYTPSVSPENFDTSVFNEVENANIRLLASYRN